MAEPSWWHVDQLVRDNMRIWISTRDTLFDDQRLLHYEVDQLVGVRRTYKRPREIVWNVRAEYGKADTRRARSMVVWSIVRQDGRLQDLPPHAFPTFWRPINLAKWPDPLPEPYPIRRWEPPAPEPTPIAEPAAPADNFEWPGAYSEPGSISAQEAEIRLMRGLRTHGTRNLEGEGRIHIPGYVDSILLVAKGELVPEWKDPTDARAIPVKWEATRRDHGDEPIVMDWYRALNPAQQFVVRRRAQLPAWSYRQIAEAPGSRFATWSQARDTYNAAIARVTRIANNGAV